MDLFSLIYKRIEGFFKSLFSKIAAKLSKLKTLPQKIPKKAKEILQGIIAFLFKKPSQLSDYIRLGSVYVAKRSFLWGILLSAALVMAIVWVIVPFIQRNFFTTKLVVNTTEFYTATGKTEVYTADGELLYAGIMDNGVITGNGRVYKDGNLVYQGDLLNNEYNGTGKLFENGKMIYSGEFSDSKFNGTGNLYYPEGGLMASGTFSENMLNGQALMFEQNGDKLYNGNFSAGAYNGYGELYEKGELIYSGEFVNGEMTGNGTKFDKGIKIYAGSFLNGVYSGEGTLYVYHGDMKLEGSFENGAANGEGTIYNSDGVRLFGGILSENEISYYNYISSDKSTVESCFTANAALREINNGELVYYTELGAGFIFDKEGKTDRIIITGENSLYRAKTGMNPKEYVPPKGAVKYSSYGYVPTDTDAKIMNYIGLSEYEEMRCDKYIKENVFIKLYYSEDKVLFYEIGAV